MGECKDLHETTGKALPVSQGHQHMAKHALPIHPVHRTAAERFKAAVQGSLLGLGGG